MASPYLGRRFHCRFSGVGVGEREQARSPVSRSRGVPQVTTVTSAHTAGMLLAAWPVLLPTVLAASSPLGASEASPTAFVFPCGYCLIAAASSFLTVFTFTSPLSVASLTATMGFCLALHINWPPLPPLRRCPLHCYHVAFPPGVCSFPVLF